MTERVVEMMDFACYGGELQQMPNAEKIREEIVHCRDCKFFDKDQVACDRWDTVFPCPSASDEGQGFCAWAKRKTK